MGWVHHGLGFVGSSSVKMIHCQTALVNISCNHEHLLIPITFICRVIYCTGTHSLGSAWFTA